jgi:large subunit ribosomal protein LP0
MEPGKTSFFQALGVPTKIARGTIEITADLKLVEAGTKVGASEATLLNMLNISPFTYGMALYQVYDQGQVFAPSVLDIEESQLLKAFSSAITTIATISLAANFPTLPSVMHSVVNSYKKVLSVAIETEYSWPEIDDLKDRIANPDAYASAAPVAAAGGDAPAAAEETKEEEGMLSLLSINTRLILTTAQPKMRSLRTTIWVSVCSTKRIFLFILEHTSDLPINNKHTAEL